MNREIVKLREALHNMAGNQPSCDPFSYAGAQVWQEWTEGCRSIEESLTDAGEVL
ncbi:MAG: hypothetical protein Q8P40_08540 [Nitrospirota bacterium]|nr:hypothetical protein [Nitrospirota bacterium]